MTITSARPAPRGGDYVPVVRVGQVDGGNEFLPLGDEGIGERDPHLPEQAGQVGVSLLGGCAPLGEEGPEGAVELGKDFGAP